MVNCDHIVTYTFKMNSKSFYLREKQGKQEFQELSDTQEVTTDTVGELEVFQGQSIKEVPKWMPLLRAIGLSSCL